MARPLRLLDAVRAELRVRRYSYRTEQAYVDWIHRFVVFHDKRHPKELGGPEVAKFLSYLAIERNVSAATQNQPLPTNHPLPKTKKKQKKNAKPAQPAPQTQPADAAAPPQQTQPQP